VPALPAKQHLSEPDFYAALKKNIVERLQALRDAEELDLNRLRTR
jgi:hypothetical protein